MTRRRLILAACVALVALGAALWRLVSDPLTDQERRFVGTWKSTPNTVSSVLVSDAARQAAASGADSTANAQKVYDLVRGMSLASAVPGNRDRGRNATQAIEFLRQTIPKGLVDISQLLADPALAPLRRRADYADLLWDLADTSAAAKPRRRITRGRFGIATIPCGHPERIKKGQPHLPARPARILLRCSLDRFPAMPAAVNERLRQRLRHMKRTQRAGRR
jgi:hypothetical protein